MIPDRFVWLLWASAFLALWGLLYLRVPARRGPMLRMSFFTAPFGLTEPLFVPEYWSPPSLFDLAQRTGFDLESVIFSFAIGGIGAVLYDALTGRRTEPMPMEERHAPRHRFHLLALASPAIAFPLLYPWPWNPIYPAILAMAVGALAAILCRPDLKAKTVLGGGLFLSLYFLFISGMEWSAPGYIDRVWRLETLTGLLLWRLPVEELFFAFAFGMYWSGLYEHVAWMRGRPRAP